MPSKVKRIAITPTERTRILLERYHKATGKSMSTMVRELLDESVPVLLEVIEMVERLKNSKPAVAKKALLQLVDDTHKHIDGVQKDIEGLFDKKRGRKPKGVSSK